MTRLHCILLVITLFLPLCHAQGSGAGQTPAAPSADAHNAPAPVISDFHVRYVSGPNVYIDGGRSAGLTVGTQLVLKMKTTGAAQDGADTALQPGVIAKLNVVSVASTSAVCEIVSSTRDLAVGDTVSLPDAEVEKIVERNTLGNTRKYPMVISFSQGDPLDEDVREAIPRPPLPEINQIRGRIGFDMSMIQQIGQGNSTSTEYGMVFRADATRILGTHWNLNGFWRGSLQRGSTPSQPTLQDLINRTYLMSLSYINPRSHWTAGIGRLYLPWASSLETIDGGYFGRQSSSRTVTGIFAGSTPDPTSWSYNPKGKIGGAFFNIHGGSYDNVHYSSTAGAGVNLIGWSVNRPFAFTENEFSFKRYFSLFHSMQIDRPTANPSTSPLSAGLGQSILSVRVQVHPRVTLDMTDSYFRDVPTYDPTLVGTGLLDKYLFQGVNGGARVQFPLHLTGYITIGRSSDSSDPKTSLNTLYGITKSNIWKTGIQADARYSKFDSAFAAGTYTSISLTRDLSERLRLNLQGGKYAYNSSLASNNNSIFVNFLFDTNLGARYFMENAFTTQRGGSQQYNQWTTTVGYRFNNRSTTRRAAYAKP
jgi:hypothetical protein